MAGAAAASAALVRDIDDVIELLFDDNVDDATACSPCDSLVSSFASTASSLGAESAVTDVCLGDVKRGMHRCSSSVSVTSDDDDDDDDASGVDRGTTDDARATAAAAVSTVSARRQRLVHAPSRVDLVHDRQRVLADRQNKLNNFVLRQQQATHVSRDDHHIMLRQLIGEAYFRDPQHARHRPRWRKILAAVRKEYWGAHAIFNLSPDPYHDVVANLSSMMLWDHDMRRWQYTYHHDELPRRQTRQTELIATLQQSGKLFLR